MVIHEEPYYMDDLENVITDAFRNCRLVGSRGHGRYYDVSCAFDIEVSSFYEHDEKRACMYVWMLGLNGYCVIGRTWAEFREALNILKRRLSLNIQTRLVLYVHNLSYEFQFIKDMFEWDNVFALDERKPNYARTKDGIEFRCSYQLSGMSLARLGNELVKYSVKKMVGDLDYSLIRHSGTPLTEKELGYCIHDVLVVMAYIQECIENEGNITLIPNTKTGYVRRDVKKRCLGTGKKRNRNWIYREYIKNLTLEPDEYMQLRRAFQGGFTHASAFHSGIELEDIDSYDFTSSYPTVMLAEKYPMSKSELVEVNDKETFEYNINRYCCLFDIEFIKIEPTQIYEDYISSSRCMVLENQVINNGRVVSADRLITTITEQDFIIIKKLYSWEKMRVWNFRRYRKDYLPTVFVESILDFYEKKTTLKGVEGKELEYALAKANLNSLYGMIVTDIVRDEITYKHGWVNTKPNLDEAIDKYNNSKARFMFYPWGVWVTAYARKNLFTGICSCETDYVYSDTDSLKIMQGEKHKQYIERYNDVITSMLEKAMDYHKISHDRLHPKTIDGVEKPIGVWDYEGHYTRFKTLGAKRYLWQKANGKCEMTVAGLSKQNGLRYLQQKYGDVFKGFTDTMYIPAEHTGKNVHTYIDEPTHGKVVDYLGSVSEYSELSSIHMEETSFTLSIGVLYMEYLKGFRDRKL